MLSKCANPDCSAPFLYLHQGKLFRVDSEAVARGGLSLGSAPEPKKPPRRTEFFWLCGDCAAEMTLAYKKGIGVVTVPVARTPAVAAAAG